jgi:lysophosphatidylcholine acyltransferase/lyso-PAF acetyltransferase
MGTARQPWTEYVRVALLGITLVPLKGLFCFVGVFFAYLCSLISRLVPVGPREAFLEVTLKFSARLVLLAVGFFSVRKVRLYDESNPYVASNIQGKRKLAREQRRGREQRTPVAVGAILSNHIGWADILVHMTQWLPSFVARDATMQLPFIGITSIAMGCLFVDREKGSGGKEVVKENLGVAAQVKERMTQVSSGVGQNRRPILLFPEGTTTNGNFLLPFRTGAFIAGVPVQPTIIKYGPSRVSPAWETIGGIWHIFLMLANPLHSVTVYELPVYMPSEEEKQSPRLFADNVRKVMLKYSALTAHDAGFDDKRVFHAALRGQETPVIKKQQ